MDYQRILAEEISNINDASRKTEEKDFSFSVKLQKELDSLMSKAFTQQDELLMKLTEEEIKGLEDDTDEALTNEQGDKSSRAQILKKASDYITFMRRKNQGHQQDIDDLKRQNTHLEKQIRTLERAKSSGNYSSAAEVLNENGLLEDASSLVTPRPHSETEFMAGNYEDGSDTSEGSTSTGNIPSSGVAAAMAPLPVTRVVAGPNGVTGARVIAPGQSLLLTTASGNAPITLAETQPPARKKLKT